jgi:hypothetical protein
VRYFNFLIRRTISKFLQNSTLRKAGSGTTKILGGILVLILTPTTATIGAILVSLYVAYTIWGSVSGSIMNMTTSSSVGSPFSAVYSSVGITSSMTGILGLFPLIIMGTVIIAVIFPMFGLLRGGGDYIG